MRWIRQIATAARFGAVLCRAFLDQRTGEGSGPQWLTDWSRIGLRTLRMEVHASGTVPSRGVLVTNHLSYLDILVLSAITPCTFVSKSEVESWPLIGSMTRRAGTIFVQRENRSHVAPVKEQMVERLRRGELVVFFPEGTSTDGNTLLRFHSSLFEAAVELGEPVYVARLVFEAEDADASNEVCYWGDMTLATHLWNFFGIKRTTARVIFGGSEVYADRKSAAIQTRESILELTPVSQVR